MMNDILLFEEWNQQLNETKYNFSYNHHRYTIHQAKTNPSKFGIKDKHGEWEVYVRNDTFDPKRFDMEDEEFLSWIQRAIKHFNILGEVTHKEVFESEWKDLFKYELKHKKPLNKRYVILKLQCGKRNAKWNIAERRSKKVDEKLEIKIMKQGILTFDEFIFESTNGTFVVKSGEAYQSLWNNSSPSISYNDTSEIFTNQRDALKYAQSKLKLAKTETSMGQGGIPSGYSYTVVDLYEIEPDMKPEEWNTRYDAEKAGAKKIELTAGGRLEEDAIKQTEEIIALSSPENVEKIEPDTKDIERANDIFSKGWYTDNKKVFTQLVAIRDPKKLIRRMKAMLYAQVNAALEKKIYFEGYELDKGFDRWFNKFPWVFNSTLDLRCKYNAKWGTKLTHKEFDNLIKAIEQSVKNKIKKENPELV